MKKVLHILKSDRFSGAENVAIQLIKQTERNYEGHYASPDGSIRDVVRENEVPFHAMTSFSLSELRRVIREVDPDMIHAHDFTCSFYVSLASKQIPIISHLHNNPPWLKKLCINSLVYGLSNFRYRHILTVSEAIMDEYIFGAWCKEKTSVVGNPIDVAHIRGRAHRAEETSAYDVVFLGRQAPPKNPLLFLDVIKECVKQIPEIHAVMIGGGSLEKQVKERIIQLGLEGNVTCRGFMQNPYGILEHSKLLCLPSKWEGFGLVAVEALSFGKPVVCSGVGGLQNIVDERVGRICSTKAEYADEICRLLTEHAYYDAKSQAALRRAELLDNVKEYRNAVLQIYDSIE